MSRCVMDRETGLIERPLNPGDVILTKEQTEYMNEHEMSFNNDAQFVKFYADIVPDLCEYLSGSELKMVVALIPYAYWEDCILAKSSRGHIQVLSSHNDIAEVTGMKIDFVRRNMLSLKNKGIIGEHETGSILKNTSYKANKVYTINPYVFFNGKNANSNVFAFYKNSGWHNKLCNG